MGSATSDASFAIAVFGGRQRTSRAAPGSQARTARLPCHIMAGDRIRTGDVQLAKIGWRIVEKLRKPRAFQHVSVGGHFGKASHCVAFSRMFQQKGYETALEQQVDGNGIVDVVAARPGERVAVEIETGKSDIKANLASCPAVVSIVSCWWPHRHGRWLPVSGRGTRLANDRLS